MDGATWEVVGDSWEEDRSVWQRTADIAPRDHQSLVEDNRGAILMYGGIPSARSGPWPTDTWELQGGIWKRVSTEGPPGRGRAALAYDSKRRRVGLFGGVSAPPGPNQPQTFFNDTWIWDGERWRQQAAEGGPRGRYAHGMVFDERAGVVLLYGGSAAHRDAPLSDMWQWDGERWTEIRMTGPTPGHRYQPVMVYDRARDRTVLYGGIGGPGDTWSGTVSGGGRPVPDPFLLRLTHSSTEEVRRHARSETAGVECPGRIHHSRSDPAPALAVATSFEELRQVLKPGQTVLVTDSSGQQIKGRVAQLPPSPSSLDLLAPKARTFAKGTVTEIEPPIPY